MKAAKCVPRAKPDTICSFLSHISSTACRPERSQFAEASLMILRWPIWKTKISVLRAETHSKAANYFVSSRLVNKCLVIRRSNRRSELVIPLITACSIGWGEPHTAYYISLGRGKSRGREKKTRQCLKALRDRHILSFNQSWHSWHIMQSEKHWRHTIPWNWQDVLFGGRVKMPSPIRYTVVCFYYFSFQWHLKTNKGKYIWDVVSHPIKSKPG